MENYIPSIYVAGMNKKHGINGIDAAYNLAALSLDDEDIMLIVTEDKENVYYIATHSHSFHSVDFTVVYGTSLANALPHTPNHQGIGIYVYPMGEYYSAISYLGDKIESFFATIQQIQEYIQKIEREKGISLEIIDTSNMEIIRWVGYRTGKTLEARLVAKKTNYICLSIILLLFVVIIGLNIFIGKYKDKPVQLYTMALEELKTMTNQINQSSINTIEKHFALIQKLGKLTSEKGGYIASFWINNNLDIYWLVIVPKWVSLDDFKTISNTLHTAPVINNQDNIYISNKQIVN